eukprot:395657-Pleurochrysis_carterae.AAC.7
MKTAEERRVVLKMFPTYGNMKNFSGYRKAMNRECKCQVLASNTSLRPRPSTPRRCGQAALWTALPCQ